MADARTAIERFLWERIGPPLYYCSECLRGVQVVPREGAEPLIKRRCAHETAQVIAPRSAVCVGEGGMNLPTRVRTGWAQLKADVTGRCA